MEKGKCQQVQVLKLCSMDCCRYDKASFAVGDSQMAVKAAGKMGKVGEMLQLLVESFRS